MQRRRVKDLLEVIPEKRPRKKSGTRPPDPGPAESIRPEQGTKDLFDNEIRLLEAYLRSQEILFLAEKADWVNALQALTTVAVDAIWFIAKKEPEFLPLLWPIHFGFEGGFASRLVKLAED